MKRFLTLILLAGCLASCQKKYDVCVYGGTASGVIAAYSAAMMGADVLLIGPDVTLGGMTTGGLGLTDIGNKQAVSGISRQFYRKLGEHYGNLEQWVFEPHVAEGILEDYLGRTDVTVIRNAYLEGVRCSNGRIRSITCAGKEYRAEQYIDCSYEGDLMAGAGVSYTVGREDNAQYGEQYNGSQLMGGHQFPDGIDPYVIPGDPASGLLWGISDSALKPDGTGDDCVQAYNYRICLTDDKDNMIPIEKPADYDPAMYDLLPRLFEAYPDKLDLNDWFIWSFMPNHKTDVNNRGAFSTDMIGLNYSYPEASREERDRILEAHRNYTLGLLYFYGHDSRVPEKLRNEMLRWGLPKDEYVRTGHWTHQLYIRECRRLVGEYVATQRDCDGLIEITDGIAMAAYQMDSHNCERIVVVKDGKAMVKNEGNVEIAGGLPYPVSYRSITPRRAECTNLLVPVCLSASHIAYGSIRMEPVFMGTGQAAGMAAVLAGNGAVQDVDVNKLQDILSSDPYLDGSEPDIYIEDNSAAVSYSGWKPADSTEGYGRTCLKLDADTADASLTYALPDGLKGTYAIYTYQLKDSGLADSIEYGVTIGMDSFTHVFNRDELVVLGQTRGEWDCLGEYEFNGEDGCSINVKVTSKGKPAISDEMLLVRVAPGNTELTVMSYNIRMGVADDGDNSWDIRKPATAEMLDTLNPDVFGVQEAFDFQLAYIQETCPRYKAVGVGRDDGSEEGEHMSVIFNTEKIELIDWGTYWLSETPDVPSYGWDAACRRTATWTKLRVKATGREFFFVNTHLDHVGVVARKEGLAMIVERIGAMNPDGIPMILTGDFNITPDNEGLVDLVKIMKNCRYEAATSDTKPSYNGWGTAGEEIDYIWYAGFEGCPMFRVVDEPYAGKPFISDHYPVLAKLEW